MDKILLTKEMLEDGSFNFEFCTFVPYQKKEEMAEKLAQATVICDPDGCAYMSYRYEPIRMFLIAEYYTNIDTSDWDTEEGQSTIFDYMTCRENKSLSRYDKMCEREEFKHDIGIVDSIYSRMYSSLASKHEHTSTLSYKIGKAFESILNDQDIVTALAQSREVSEKMIDMISVFNKTKNEKGNTNPNATVQGVLNFAKK